jgi:hypothetical protein
MFILILNNVLCKENEVSQVGTFTQEVSTFYTTDDGLPDADVRAIAVAQNGDVYAATGKGLALFSEGRWTQVKALAGNQFGFLQQKEIWWPHFLQWKRAERYEIL